MIATLLTTMMLAPSLTLSVKVDGDGYLRFGDRGRVVYATSAKLVVSEDGRLIYPGGAVLLPSVEVPKDTEKLGSDLEGHISATVHGEKKVIGRIVLAFFESEPKLTQQGDFLIARSRPLLRDPGEAMAGVIRVEGGNDTSAPQTTSNSTGSQPIPRTNDNPNAVQIEVPESVMLTGDRIKLGDIATITGKDNDAVKLKEIDLGMTPITGVTIRISRESISYQIKKLGYLTSSFDLRMPAAVSISREGQKITQAQFLEAAIKAVQEKLGVATPLSGDQNGPDFFAPKGALELRMENMSPKDGELSVVMAVYVDGKRLNSRTLKLSGQGLTQGVKAGQLVKVRFITSGYVAEISGRTKQNGFLGQTVEVTVQYDGPGTTTTHAATVIGEGIVEVRL